MKKILVLVLVFVGMSAFAQTADFYNEQGREKLRVKNYPAAVEDFSEAVKIDKKCYAAFFNRALAKQCLEDYKGALADYNKAAKINPQDPDIFYRLGEVKRKLGDDAGAIKDYTTAINLNPKDGYYYLDRGVAKLRTGDLVGAKDDWSKTIALMPDYATPYFNLGLVNYDEKNYAETLKMFETVEKLGLTDKQDLQNLYYYRAAANYHLQNYDESIKNYKKITEEINPEFAPAWYEMGLVYQEKKDLDNALKMYEKARDLASKSGDKHYYNSAVLRIDSIKK